MLRGIVNRALGGGRSAAGAGRPSRRRGTRGTTGGSTGGAERGARMLFKGMSRRRRGL